MKKKYRSWILLELIFEHQHRNLYIHFLGVVSFLFLLISNFKVLTLLAFFSLTWLFRFYFIFLDVDINGLKGLLYNYKCDLILTVFLWHFSKSLDKRYIHARYKYCWIHGIMHFIQLNDKISIMNRIILTLQQYIASHMFAASITVFQLFAHPITFFSKQI